MSAFLSVSKACWCLDSHLNLMFLLVRSVRGAAVSANLGTKPRQKFTSPRNDCSSLLVLGVGQVEMLFVFSGEGATPSAEYSYPKCVVLVFLKKHFEPRRVRPAACSWPRTAMLSEKTIQSST